MTDRDTVVIMPVSEDEILSRRDSASRGIGFLSWLAQQRSEDPTKSGPHASLYFMNDAHRFNPLYEFNNYVKVFSDMFADDKQKIQRLTVQLLRAESDWRVEKNANKKARKALGMNEDSTHGVTPLPVKDVICGFRDRGGIQCTDLSVPGVVRCAKHGGALVDPSVRQSMLMVAYARLVEGSDTAVEALIDVAENGRSEMARVQAAKEILDRSGLSPEIRVTVEGEFSEETPIDRLRARLVDVRGRLQTDVSEIEDNQRAALEATAMELEPAVPGSATDALPTQVTEKAVVAEVIDP